MNRGIARRTLFEGRADIRHFLSGIARAVRSGQLEIHAYCVMTTHFHLLVRSPRGDLSEAMRRVQLDHARRFNRSRHRDGPLFRGRFTSKPVSSMTYRRILVRYIDRNPVQAGMCVEPAEHPYGSARWYARLRGPPWLCRSWVEDEVRSAVGSRHYEPVDYLRVFGRSTDAELGLMDRRLASSGEEDALDDLVHATPSRVLAWMRWKARLADGTEPGLPVADAGCVDQVVRAARKDGSEELLARGRADRLSWMHAGLLRILCGASLAEIGMRTQRSVSTAGELCRQHSASLSSDEAYAQHAGRLARTVIALQHPMPPRPLAGRPGIHATAR